MGQTEMLEDLVGMVQGLDGDEDLEIGSYQNSENLNSRVKKPAVGGVPSTNTTSFELKNRMGEMMESEDKIYK